MTALSPSTNRRLKKLRQVPSIWEGDRRPLSPGMMSTLDAEVNGQGECILWVDGTEGMVRAMDVVLSEVNNEAIVRTLIRAMESPHSASQPARPQKIVVRDRELQFFLRGVLQDLGIAVDYEPELPLIDEIFRSLQEGAESRPPQLPPQHAAALLSAAHDLWHDAPWEALDEERVLAVELNYGDVETLYVSILGMLGMEYGILMYRSLDSLKQFRQRVLVAQDSPQEMEAAFLEQDCFFLTFDRDDEDEDEEMEPTVALGQLRAVPPFADVQPTFGSLHPLEGMRPMLYEDEAAAVRVAIAALHRFFQTNLKRLAGESFPALTGSYRIPDPDNAKKKVAVKVSTLPEVAAELFEMSTTADLSALEERFELGFAAPTSVLRMDLVPEDAFFSLGAMAWDIVDVLRSTVGTHQSAPATFPATSDGFPVILIQTSRPKAIALIEGLQAAGGLAAICFNPGEAPFSAQRYDLGILQTHNGELHLFGEFEDDDPIHIQARKKWDQRCKKTQGHCGLVIAKGLKGMSRGNPDLKDMMALFEVRSISPQELGLGRLELVLEGE